MPNSPGYPTPAAPLPIPTVETRYTSATLEKCARIQARQFVQLTYVTIAATLVAAVLAGKLDLSLLGNYAAFVLVVGAPCVAAMFAAWCGNQDSIIALLDSYCLALERYGAKKSGCADVPCWYDPRGRWFERSVIGRYWSNVAFGVALFAASMPGTLLIYSIGQKKMALGCQMILVCLIIVYRFWRLPPSRQPTGQLRYYIVTSSLFVGIAAMCFIYAHATVSDAGGHVIMYSQHIMVSSMLASMLPLVVHFEFEKRRIDFLADERKEEVEAQEGS